MLEDMLADHAADAALKRSKQTAGVDNLKPETVAASNKSLSNILFELQIDACVHSQFYCFICEFSTPLIFLL